MNNYNSHATTHAGYIIALIVGALSIIARWKDLWVIGNTVFLVSTRVFLVFIVLGIFSIIIFFSSRVVFWATLSDQVLIVTEEEISPERTIIISIEYAAVRRFKSCSIFPNLKWFANLSYANRKWFLALLISSSLVLAIHFEYAIRLLGY
jgi:hypothetical protein